MPDFPSVPDDKLQTSKSDKCTKGPSLGVGLASLWVQEVQVLRSHFQLNWTYKFKELYHGVLC